MLILLFACQTESNSTYEPQVVSLDADIAETDSGEAPPNTWELLNTSNTSEPVLLGRRINAYNATDPGPQELTLSGDAGSITTTSDAFGYFQMPLDAGSDRIISYQLSDSEDISALAHQVSSAPNLTTSLAHHLPPDLQEPDFIALGKDGYIMGKDTKIWWKDKDIEALPYVVAQFPEIIKGMWSAQIDSDGILDVIAWSDTYFFLLRGRPNGGMSWGGGYRTPNKQIVAASASDLNGDLVSDLAIAVNPGQESLQNTSDVLLMIGDGNWNFYEEQSLELTFPIESMVAADENGDGAPDITLINADTGILRRYTHSAAGWIGGQPSVIAPTAYLAAEGSYLHPMADLNLDGRPDLIVIGGPKTIDGKEQQKLVFFIIGEEVVKYEQEYTPYYPFLMDINQDGATDILTLDEEDLRFLSYDPQTTNFSAKTVTGFGESAPFVIDSLNGDNQPDLLFASSHLSEYSGEFRETSDWIIKKSTWWRYNRNADYGYFLGHFNTDNYIDLIVLQNDNNRGKIESFHYCVHTYTLQLFDEGGDGWDAGTSVDIYKDGELIEDYSINDNLIEKEYSFCLPSGSELAVGYSGQNSPFATEQSFNILNEDNELIFASENAPANTGYNNALYTETVPATGVPELSPHNNKTTFAQEGATILDIDRCDDTVAIIVQEGNTNTLSTHKLNGTEWTSNSVSISETMVDCSYDSLGRLRVAVASANSARLLNVILTDPSALQNEYTPPQPSEWQDMALSDVNGDEIWEIHGCTQANCVIKSADLNGDNRYELIVLSDSEGDGTITVTMNETTFSLEQTGMIDIQDLEDDGASELIVQDPDGEYIWIYRGLSNGIAPPVGFRILYDNLHPPQFADINNDDQKETLLYDPAETILLSELSE